MYQEILGEIANRHLEVLVEKAVKQYSLNSADREDLAQIMVRYVLKRAHEYNEAMSSRDTWLCSLLDWAARSCLSEILRAKQGQGHQDLDALDENETQPDLLTGPPRPGNHVEETEVKRITVHNFIRKMNPEFREICMRLASGEKPTQIARAMNLSRKALRLRMARLKMLAQENGLRPSHLNQITAGGGEA